MDTSPNRSRNRRADRYAEEAAAPREQTMLSGPERPTYVPEAPAMFQQPPGQHQPLPPAQPQVRSQAEMVAQMQARAQAQARQQLQTQQQAQVRSQAQMVAQMQARAQAQQRMQQPQARSQAQMAPPMQPMAQAQPYAAPAPATRQAPYSALGKPARIPDVVVEEEDEEAPGMPWQLTTALVLSFLLVLGLIAAMFLMQAYLKQQADERVAAHLALLDFYHVTEAADGRYRVTYQETIERYADQYNLQPAYIAAIIRNESSFRTDAESNVGARGLMQLMPDTAEWIAHKLGVRYSFEDMYDAETNIAFGTWYLNYLSELFYGDPILVTAAYHAGQTTVAQWLSDRSMSPDGETIPLDKLVDGPTKNYAGRVTQAYGIYQALLYPGEALAESAVASVGTDAPAVPTPFIQR